ncbi:hypothetical protein BDN70DRAFT_939027 [Pholiota conissans]|uniref:Uncharacterized protein n=1 Tax=Pholiota conissans TaxID=109636 RepID=A0A9P5YLG8_9AGAR|nr:hypothetical protein BDN70DRAFT_939027 [Pholiota conissans]
MEELFFVIKFIDDFQRLISTFITIDNFTKTIAPTIEKALLRSPEYSLPVVTQFFSAYTHPLALDSFQKLLTQIISSAKLSNPTVRTNSVDFFKVLISCSDPADPHNLARVAVPELVSLPNSGKSAGPDHRVALYTMLASVTPTAGVSLPVIQAITTLIAKEPHEVLQRFWQRLWCLMSSSSSERARFQLIRFNSSKEMNSPKIAVRKSFVGLAGSIFTNDQMLLETENGLALAKALLPSFETCLKNVSSNPLNASGGPFEDYVALGVLLDAAISQNSAISVITTTSAKQSFLLWDKAYQKVTSEEDERWLLRAADVALQYFSHDLAKNETLRSQLGHVYVHLAIESLHPEIR